MATETRSALREEQTEVTRSRILDAVVRIVAANVTGLSVEAVAREAGVSRPTVYRYFPTKRAMVDAVGERYADRLGTGASMSASSLDEVLGQVPAIFSRWERLEPELRAAVTSTHGADQRARLLPERLAATRRMVDPYAGGWSAVDRERLVRALVILMSSGMAEITHRYLGASAAESADLVVWMIHRLVGNGRDGAR